MSDKKDPTIYPKRNKENWTNTIWSTAYGGVLRYLGWSSVKASGTLTSVHIYTHTYVRRSVWIYTPRNPQFSYSNFGGTHSITRQERMKPKNNTLSSPVQAVTRNSLVPNFTNNCFFNFLHLLILLCASFKAECHQAQECEQKSPTHGRHTPAKKVSRLYKFRWRSSFFYNYLLLSNLLYLQAAQ